MSQDKVFQQASNDFMTTNPSKWASPDRVINLLNLPSLPITSHGLQQALVREGYDTITHAVTTSNSNHSFLLRQAERTLCSAM